MGYNSNTGALADTPTEVPMYATLDESPAALSACPVPAPDRAALPPRPVGRPVPGTLLRARWVRALTGGAPVVEVLCGSSVTTYPIAALELEALDAPEGYAARILDTVRAETDGTAALAGALATPAPTTARVRFAVARRAS